MKKATTWVAFFIFVLSVGIEPTLPAPQASVLSIERRELSETMGGMLAFIPIRRAKLTYPCESPKLRGTRASENFPDVSDSILFTPHSQPFL